MNNFFCWYDIRQLNRKRKVRRKFNYLLGLSNVPDEQLWDRIKNCGIRFYTVDHDGAERIIPESYLLDRVLKERGTQ